MHIRFFLGNDGINTEGGFTDLAIANDQLTLTASHRGHSINCLTSSVAWLMNTLPGDNTRSNNLHLGEGLGVERTLTVYGGSNTVNNAAFHFRTNRNLGNLAGSFDDVAFLNSCNISKNSATNVILLQVQGEAKNSTWELEKLHGHAVLNSMDTGNTVTNRNDCSSFTQINFSLILFDLALDNLTDFFSFNLHCLFTPFYGLF